ncbi:hypothetical protein V2G26_008768 [Clonostachys chloroleuca]
MRSVEKSSAVASAVGWMHTDDGGEGCMCVHLVEKPSWFCCGDGGRAWNEEQTEGSRAAPRQLLLYNNNGRVKKQEEFCFCLRHGNGDGGWLGRNDGQSHPTPLENYLTTVLLNVAAQLRQCDFTVSAPNLWIVESISKAADRDKGGCA